MIENERSLETLPIKTPNDTEYIPAVPLKTCVMKSSGNIHTIQKVFADFIMKPLNNLTNYLLHYRNRSGGPAEIQNCFEK